jgi:hypothetical protein
VDEGCYGQLLGLRLEESMLDGRAQHKVLYSRSNASGGAFYCMFTLRSTDPRFSGQ